MEKKNINLEYGKILREYRNKNNLTQEEVSELSGLATRYISQIERGEAKGSIDTLLTFCEVYKITPNDVLTQFLNLDASLKKDSYDTRINKLSIRDKEIIDDLLSFLLNH